MSHAAALPSERQASRRERAAALAATRRRLFFAGALLGIVAPWALWASGASDALWRSVDGWSPWIGLPCFIGLVTLLLIVVSTPLSYYGGFVVPHRYGLSRQTVGGWLVDWVKSTLIGVVLTTAAASLFYATVWALPTLWWLAFWAEAMAALVLLTFAAPYVFVPLFFKPRPVEDPGLVALIEDLVRRAGTTVAGISRLDFSRRTNEANAAVIGFGRSRRVVLADTLLESFTPSEIRAVVAHELGHHVHRDVARLLALQAALLFVGLGLGALLADPLLRLLGAAPLASPPTYPLLVVATGVFGAINLPLVNWFSRRVEAQADTYAFTLLEDGRPFASAMRRLADQNLAEEWPPRWAEVLLASHPAIGRRIQRAEGAR